MTIDVLSDYVLLEIFFHVNIRDWESMQIPWRALVGVCRRWRYLVFASPRRLNLRLEYFGHGPMSEVPDAWLVLPVILTSRVQFLPSELPVLHPKSGQWRNNIVALLESEHYNRICEIYI